MHNDQDQRTGGQVAIQFCGMVGEAVGMMGAALINKVILWS